MDLVGRCTVPKLVNLQILWKKMGTSTCEGRLCQRQGDEEVP